MEKGNTNVKCRICNQISTVVQLCSRCHSVCYCSRKCQIKDWTTHKNNCLTTVKKVDILFNKAYNHSLINIYIAALKILSNINDVVAVLCRVIMFIYI